MESALKKHRQENGWSSNTDYIFLIQATFENMFYCFLTQKHCSFRDINKIDFIIIFGSVHVTFKPVKKCILIAIFHIDPTHRKLVAEMYPIDSFQPVWWKYAKIVFASISSILFSIKLTVLLHGQINNRYSLKLLPSVYHWKPLKLRLTQLIRDAPGKIYSSGICIYSKDALN